jgi:alkanesulfonate monooxygenase SsuD/methylene tetrahydromethanopterin reductase-like flavin-dependent oxidoreductase (luciferase family)
MRAYRQAFRPSAGLAAPAGSLAVFALCADTDAEARRQAKSRDLFLLRLYTGRFGPYPSVEEAESYPYIDRDLAIIQHTRQRTIAGSPERVRERLVALAGDYGVEELVVVSMAHDFKTRIRSYELLADAFSLARRL